MVDLERVPLVGPRAPVLHDAPLGDDADLLPRVNLKEARRRGLEAEVEEIRKRVVLSLAAEERLDGLKMRRLSAVFRQSSVVRDSRVRVHAQKELGPVVVARD